MYLILISLSHSLSLSLSTIFVLYKNRTKKIMKNGLNVILSFFQPDSIDQYVIRSSSPVDSCVFPKDLGIFIVKIRISLSTSKVEKLHYANTVER